MFSHSTYLYGFSYLCVLEEALAVWNGQDNSAGLRNTLLTVGTEISP